jgi:hypothetical protein
MKQSFLRTTFAVSVVLLGAWGCAAARSANASAVESRSGTSADFATAVPASARDEIVFFGRCVNADAHLPIAGVSAIVHRDVPQRDVCDNELVDDPPVAQTMSGADGTFRLVLQRVADAEYAVRVGNREHVHRTRSFGPYKQAREIDLGDAVLQRGVQVTLSVVDRRGERVGGIRVGASEQHPEGRHDMLMVDTGFPWRSDVHGAIELPYAMRPGHYHIAWFSAGLPGERSSGDLEVPANRDRFAAVLVWPVEDERHAIRGRVVDVDGKPVADVDLGAEGGGTRGNAKTRADGAFHMPRIGPYDENAIGPVALGLPNPVCGLEFVGEPTCNWGDHEVVLVVRATALLVVRAVDAISGAVVSDVQLACAAHCDEGPPVVVYEPTSPVESRPDGSARLRAAKCVYDVQVFPRDPGYAPSAKVTWDARSGGELVVPVARTQSATVRVVTADGEPVVGAELWSQQPIEAVAGAPAAAGWREVLVPGRPDAELAPSRRWSRQGIDDAPLGTARTDADGRAQLRVPVDTDVVLAAFGPGHVPKAIIGRATTSEIELRVERGTTVRFVLKPKDVVARLISSAAQQRLTEAGSSDIVFGGVYLNILPAPDADPRLVMETVVIPLTADGVCGYRGLPPGKYDLGLAGTIESGVFDGIETLRMFPAVVLHDGATNDLELDVANLALGRMQGQVLLNGQPCAHAAGSLWSMDWPAHRIIVPVVTDANGRFDVEAPAFRDGYYLRGLCTSAGQIVSCAETVHLTPGSTISTVFTACSVTARARIVDATGAPATGLEVTTDRADPDKSPVSAVTDGDGWVTFRLDSSAPFHLIVRNPNGTVKPGRRTTISGDAVLGPFDVPVTGDHAEFQGVLPEGWH